MRAHNVIIVTSETSRYLNTSALDQLIQKVLHLKKNPILVLGSDGDEFLRSCQDIEQCDIVFDPNDTGNLFSGIKAGLHSTNGAAFVIPLTQSLPDDSLWSRMEQLLVGESAETNADVIRPVSDNDDPSHFRYPVLVTRKGVQNLLKLEATTNWETSEKVISRLIPVEANPQKPYICDALR